MPKPSTNQLNRRTILRGAACAIACSCPLIEVNAAKAKKPDRMRPQVGDVLAYPSWENAGALIRASEILSGAQPILVYPRDPNSGITRERSRLNQLLLVRLPTSGEQSLQAYSGVCTHTACAVSEWNSEEQHFICPCHSSEFDPLEGGKVVNGPARRALPSLPIAIEGEAIIVTGEFSARVGAKKKR